MISRFSRSVDGDPSATRRLIIGVSVPLAVLLASLAWWTFAVPPWAPIGDLDACAAQAPVKPDDAVRISARTFRHSFWDLRWSRIGIGVKAVFLERVSEDTVRVYSVDCPATITCVDSCGLDSASIEANRFAWAVLIDDPRGLQVTYVDRETGEILGGYVVFEFVIRPRAELGPDLVLPATMDVAVAGAAAFWWAWSRKRASRKGLTPPQSTT